MAGTTLMKLAKTSPCTARTASRTTCGRQFVRQTLTDANGDGLPEETSGFRTVTVCALACIRVSCDGVVSAQSVCLCM
jgi:hypothetical protein